MAPTQSKCAGIVCNTGGATVYVPSLCVQHIPRSTPICLPPALAMKTLLKKIVPWKSRSRSATPAGQVPASGSVASPGLPVASSAPVIPAYVSKTTGNLPPSALPLRHLAPPSVRSHSCSSDDLASLSMTPLPVNDQLTPTSEPFTVITSPHRSSNAKSITKNVFKATLILANAALTGVPIPAKGAIAATIKLIEIAEVNENYFHAD
jgi:hypothetical protein